MWAIGVFFIALLIIFSTHWIGKWRNPKCNGVLPPGSMGLPLIGETLQLFMPSYSMDLHPFIKKRIERFGPIFRTSLAGRPVVVSADPELNNYIFQEDCKMAEVYYMDTFSKIFALEGETRLNLAGSVHKYIRNLPLVHFGPQKLKEGLLSEIEIMVGDTLHIWSKQASVEVKHASSVMLCDFIAKHLFSNDGSCESSSKMSEKFVRMVDGLMSFPLNVPGTAFYRCLKDKDKVVTILKDIIKKRLSSPEVRRGDFLDQAIADLNTEKFLTEDFIVHLLFGILFAGFESNSAVITSAFHFLQENPSVLQELTAEHEEILKRRENPDSPLTWDEYKSMTFTLLVINETLRLTNVAPGLLRRALKDINVKGYTIPAGWAILVATPVFHLNPETYKDPLAFNPWRWKELEPHVVSKNLMPFGGGTRQCAGAEFSKALLATFLHVLVTKYRWTKIKGGRFVRNPLLGCDGLYINFMEKHN